MLLFSDVLYMLVRYASPWSYVLEVPDVDFIRPCGVVVFTLFYCHLAVVSVMLVICSLSVFLSVSVCFMLDCIGELFVECVCYLCG